MTGLKMDMADTRELKKAVTTIMENQLEIQIQLKAAHKLHESLLDRTRLCRR